MAGGQPTDPRALHADLRILAEPGRGLVRDHREAGHPPWNLRIGTRPHRQDPSVHQWLEQPMPPIRVDQDGRPNPHESQPSKELTHGPLDGMTTPYGEGDGAVAVLTSGSGAGVAVVVSGVGSGVDSLLDASLGESVEDVLRDVVLGLVGGSAELGEVSGELVDGSGELAEVSGELGEDVGTLDEDAGGLVDVVGELLGEVVCGLVGVSAELLGEGSPLPPVGVALEVGVGVGVLGRAGGASWRIATISPLNASS